MAELTFARITPPEMLTVYGKPRSFVIVYIATADGSGQCTRVRRFEIQQGRPASRHDTQSGWTRLHESGFPFFSQHGPEAMMAIAFTRHPSVCPSLSLLSSTIVEVFETIIATGLKSLSMSRVVFYITTIRFGKFRGTAGFWGDFEVEKLDIFIHFERTLWKFLKLL